MLHDEDADLPAGGCPADRVCHVEAYPLLPHDDRPDVSLGRAFEDVVDWIAGDDFDTFALEDLPNRGGYLHGFPFPRDVGKRTPARMWVSSSKQEIGRAHV